MLRVSLIVVPLFAACADVPQPAAALCSGKCDGALPSCSALVLPDQFVVTGASANVPRDENGADVFRPDELASASYYQQNHVEIDVELRAADGSDLSWLTPIQPGAALSVSLPVGSGSASGWAVDESHFKIGIALGDADEQALIDSLHRGVLGKVVYGAQVTCADADGAPVTRWVWPETPAPDFELAGVAMTNDAEPMADAIEMMHAWSQVAGAASTMPDFPVGLFVSQAHGFARTAMDYEPGLYHDEDVRGPGSSALDTARSAYLSALAATGASLPDGVSVDDQLAAAAIDPTKSLTPIDVPLQGVMIWANRLASFTRTSQLE